MRADQLLGDLHGVERGALAQVVGDAPEGEPVRHRRVLAQPADVNGVLAGALLRGDVAFVGAVVDDADARRRAQRRPGFLLADRLFELDVHRRGMADEHRHTHAGRGNLDVGIEDLARLTAIFHSSLVEPSSMNKSMCGMTLKAICLVNFFWYL